ncbi:RIB43A-like with coiled-coils protein 1 [Procambarus clarkii]|uniref:RIB43A-like with coiled-coils protein 1 n=1 Tax=Procambarus clarkii TaxID=6728 RepID=UPI001E678140|nr:RIB43A-like with coiled-coils protein 1 [Procambarus clarkii]
MKMSGAYPAPPASTTRGAGFPSSAALVGGGPSLPSWVLEQKEAARIAHRRRLLQERAVRIHQPRATSIAVDVEGLSQQVEERRRQEDGARRTEEEFGRLAATQDRAALLIQHQEDKEREGRRDDLLRYWREEQRPERRREHDLNSHQHLASSLYQLEFDGEDEGMSERLRAQKEQTKTWLQEQQQQQRQRLLQERERDRVEELEALEASERARELAEAEDLCRRAEQLAIDKYNEALSRERESARCAQRQADLKAEQQELRNAVLGTFLTEDPTVARSALGPHRVIPDRWKGMSAEQKRHIADIRAQQVEERKHRQELEARDAGMWEAVAARADRAGLLISHSEQLHRRSLEAEVRETNLRLAEDQRSEQSRLNHLLTTNVPTDHFYSKFGGHPR